MGHSCNEYMIYYQIWYWVETDRVSWLSAAFVFPNISQSYRLADWHIDASDYWLLLQFDTITVTYPTIMPALLLYFDTGSICHWTSVPLAFIFFKHHQQLLYGQMTIPRSRHPSSLAHPSRHAYHISACHHQRRPERRARWMQTPYADINAPDGQQTSNKGKQETEVYSRISTTSNNMGYNKAAHMIYMLYGYWYRSPLID